MSVAGLISIPSGAKAFSTQNSYSNSGTISINLGKVKGIVYAQSPALSSSIKCFMAKTSSVEVVGSALSSNFDSCITASISNGDLIINSKTTSGTGFINLYVWYFN